jgi:hypothetical protein
VARTLVAVDLEAVVVEEAVVVAVAVDGRVFCCFRLGFICSLLVAESSPTDRPPLIIPRANA